MALWTSTLNRPAPGELSCVVSHLMRHSAFPISNESVCWFPCPVQAAMGCHTTMGFGSGFRAEWQAMFASAATINNVFRAGMLGEILRYHGRARDQLHMSLNNYSVMLSIPASNRSRLYRTGRMH